MAQRSCDQGLATLVGIRRTASCKAARPREVHRLLRDLRASLASHPGREVLRDDPSLSEAWDVS